MRTSWLKFSGIAGAILTAVGLGALTVFGTSIIPLVTFTHLFLGIFLLTFWFIFEGTRAISRPGGIIAERTLRFGSSAFAYTALFVALLAGINYLGHKYNERFDLTENGVFSLSPQSKEVLERLDGKLKIVAFQEGGQLGESAELLKLYHQSNRSQVSFEIIDPRSKPHLIEKYGMKQGNLIYLEYNHEGTKGVSRINSSSEEELTNSIVKLTRGAAKKIYFVSGHGEPSISDGSEQGLKTLAEAMGDEHLQVESLLLSTLEEVPQDAAAIFLIAPQKAVQPAELTLLRNFVDSGGSLFVMTEPRQAPEVVDFLAAYGVSVNTDVVVDTVQRLFAGPAIGVEPIASSYGVHPITRSFTNGQDISIFNIASSVEINDEKKVEGATYTRLVNTSAQSWAESNLAAIFDADEPTVGFDESDKMGPVSLALSYEKELQGKDAKGQARLVVFGDSDWVRNARIGNFFNRDLVLNSTSWLSGQAGGLTIRPRTMKASATAMTPADVKRILAASFVVPELILLVGLLVWWRRREVQTNVQMA